MTCEEQHILEHQWGSSESFLLSYDHSKHNENEANVRWGKIKLKKIRMHRLMSKALCISKGDLHYKRTQVSELESEMRGEIQSIWTSIASVANIHSWLPSEMLTANSSQHGRQGCAWIQVIWTNTTGHTLCLTHTHTHTYTQQIITALPNIASHVGKQRVTQIHCNVYFSFWGPISWFILS